MYRLIMLPLLVYSSSLMAQGSSGIKDDYLLDESTLDKLFGLIHPFPTLPGPLVLTVTLILFAVGVTVSMAFLNKRRK